MLAPEIVGVGLLLLALALLVVEQRLFNYQDSEIVQKMILALANYGLLLISIAYGLRIS